MAAVSGRMIASCAEKSAKAKAVMWTNIAINLLILGVFKYYNFFATSLSEVVSAIGYQFDMVTLQVVLPLFQKFVGK